MHPFDLKSILLARHAQHVVLIHFPIALYIAGVFFDFLSRGKKQSGLATAAYFNFSLAALSVVPVWLTGLLAWQFALEGQKLKGLLLQHLVLGVTSGLLITISWWIHRTQRRTPGDTLPAYRLLLELVTVGIVGLTGHLGGFLSGVNT